MTPSSQPRQRVTVANECKGQDIWAQACRDKAGRLHVHVATDRTTLPHQKGDKTQVPPESHAVIEVEGSHGV